MAQNTKGLMISTEDDRRHLLPVGEIRDNPVPGRIIDTGKSHPFELDNGPRLSHYTRLADSLHIPFLFPECAGQCAICRQPLDDGGFYVPCIGELVTCIGEHTPSPVAGYLDIEEVF